MGELSVTIEPEDLKLLHEAFRSLPPADKAQVVGKIASMAGTQRGFFTEEGEEAIPVDFNLGLGLPEPLKEAIFKILPTSERNFKGVPVEFIPPGPQKSVEWKPLVETCLAAVPREDVRQDITDHVKTFFPIDGDTVSQIVLSSMVEAIGERTGKPLDSKDLIDTQKKLQSLIFKQMTQEMLNHKGSAKIAYQASNSIVVYLGDVNLADETVTIPRERLELIK